MKQLERSYYRYDLYHNFGLVKGIYYSIFHSISAFCNAGLDIIGPNSFIPYVNDWLVSTTIALLIIVGGLGFIVWQNILTTLLKCVKNKFGIKRFWRELTLHTKLVLCITAILLISGTVLFFIVEYANPNTMEPMKLSDKILASSFLQP